MREGWQVRKLAELVVAQNGYAFSSSDYAQTGHFVMRIGNVQNGYISTADPKYIRLPVDGSLNRFVLSEGDILVSLTGNVGRVGVIKDEHLPAALNQRVAKISIRNNSPATKEFLLLFLGSDWFREELTGAGHGAAQQNVSTKDLLEIEVAVPPLPEQQRIVALLDEAFAGLATANANAERNLQNVRALFESHLQSVFSQQGEGWVEATLGEVCEMYQPKTIGLKDLVSDGQYPVFGANGIIGRYDKFNHEDPQLLITCRGATCGSVNISEPFSWITGNAMVVRPLGAALDLGYLEYAFRGGINTSEAITGSAQPQITRTNLSPLAISFPSSVEEQQRLAVRFQSLAAETQHLTSLYERKLAALEELKKSLLHQAFNGEL
jgi:type I restriction enzyme, S subunit